ncbi:uncharacterized protein LOC134223194 [Armigeres subalbatus]|uniref:uncharacterized protein LOC134223194 n=1 Tax=Armigeres subalbatus TaxID=124917 RepID=UPI002ED5C04F
MNRLTRFETPLYTRVPEHPGVWQPHLYRPRPIKTAMESSDPHLLDGYAFRNLYIDSAAVELPAHNHPDAERYEDFIARIADMKQGAYSCIHREHFEGKQLGGEFLKQDWWDQSNTTYRRYHCGSNRNLDSLDIQRRKIRAGKRRVSIPPGWTFEKTSSAAAHRSWEELAGLKQTADTSDHDKQ